MKRPFALLLLGLVTVLATACSSSESRLTNAEIDRACALATRCTGISSATCVDQVLDARALADTNGCASEFAAVNRCYLRADTCGATATCSELQDALVSCSTRRPDAGPSPDAPTVVGTGALTNAEIDQWCALWASCVADSAETCVPLGLELRAGAADYGCSDQVAAALRCVVREDSCSVTAECTELQTAADACLPEVLAYQACFPEGCAAGLICLATVDGPRFCSATCETSSDCPDDRAGFGGFCRRGWCVQTCAFDSDCEATNLCGASGACEPG